MMKTNLWKVAVAAVAAIAVLVGCTKNTPTSSSPKATLTAGSAFSNGSVTLTVALSDAASSDVTVNLGVSGTVPEAKLTWNPTVTIAKGSKSADVKVTVNTDGIAAGDYSAKFAIVSVSGAEKGSPAEATVALKVEPVQATPDVNISAYDAEFANGSATLTLTLSAAAAQDVKVSFELATTVEEGAIIPAAALSFDNPATIAKGATSAVVTVTLDESAIVKGSNWAIISIKSAEGANVGSKTTAYIEAVGAIKIQKNPAWTIEYTQNYEYEGEKYDLVNVKGIKTQPFLMFKYEEGVISSNFDTFEEYVAYMNDQIDAAIASGATAEELDVVVPSGSSDDYGILYDPFSPGSYDIVVLACGENGALTGEYTNAVVKVEDAEVATEAYKAWLGVWSAAGTLGGAAQEGTFYILPEWNNKSFLLYGFEPSEDGSFSIDPVKLRYDATNNQVWMDFGVVYPTSSYYFYMSAVDNNNYVYTGGYSKPGTEEDEFEDNGLAYFKNESGAVTLNPHTVYFTYQGKDYVSTPTQYVGLLGYSSSESQWYTFRDLLYLDFQAGPATFTYVQALPSSASVKSVKTTGREALLKHERRANLNAPIDFERSWRRF